MAGHNNASEDIQLDFTDAELLLAESALARQVSASQQYTASLTSSLADYDTAIPDEELLKAACDDTTQGQDRQTDTLVSRLIKQWVNPVFKATRPSLLDGNAPPRTALSVRTGRDSLGQATVVGQVDRKYILIVCPLYACRTSHNTTDATRETVHGLVLIDQHAASERIILERLLEELCTPNNAKRGPCRRSAVHTLELVSGLQISMNLDDAQVAQDNLKGWAGRGLVYDVLQAPHAAMVQVRCLPSVIFERCVGDSSLLVSLLLSNIHAGRLRSVAVSRADQHIRYSPLDWTIRRWSCPHALLDLLKSRACRSAIMFNDPLSLDKCRTLVTELGKCRFAFYCAHARPTCVVLGNF